MAKKKGPTFGEKTIWYLSVLAALISVITAAPVVAWRKTPVITDIGDRFVMERKYSLMSATNNFGASVSWLTLAKNMQRKSTEFGTPNMVTALIGAASSAMGAGGAAGGCGTWQICKENVNARMTEYYKMGYLGIAVMIAQVISAICSVGTTMLLGFEGDVKKKKKKKSDDFEPKTKTMIAAILAFMFSAGFVVIWNAMSAQMFATFKMTSYYPHGKMYVGLILASGNNFVQFIVMLVAINRQFPFCGKKKKSSDDEAEDPYGGAYAGGYGAPDGKGGFGPPGGYGKGGW